MQDTALKITQNLAKQAIETLTVCSYHVTYEFQRESTLYSCLNVKNIQSNASYR